MELLDWVRRYRKERERRRALYRAIQGALIYDPDQDRYKIKHTAYPNLLKAKLRDDEMEDL
jgi:hypothetical protein